MDSKNTSAALIEYDDGVERAAHSVKGASSAERWLNCSGSSALIAAYEMPVTDEPSYRAEGTAMHEVGADLLARDADAWEVAGEKVTTPEGTEVVITDDMANAVQVYLDRVRPSIDREKGFHREQFFIEAKLAAPEVHEQMFGSVDFAALVSAAIALLMGFGDDVPAAANDGFLDVTDLKGGEGIEVSPVDNAQMKYYAFMLIATKFQHLEDDFPVRLTIVQPRCFSHDGPVRDWWTTVGEIKAWVVRDLLPAMHSTDDDLQAGTWCRFCPAKLVCPLLTGLFRAAASYDPKAVEDISSQALGLSYNKVEAVKFYLKALEDEVFRRLKTGSKVPGTKLVNKKAHRIFKDTVTVQVNGEDTETNLIEEVKRRFGDGAFSTPELKSPAELEKLGAEAKKFVHEYAYMPVTGLTVATENDRRTGITVATAEERFGGIIENLKGEDT